MLNAQTDSKKCKADISARWPCSPTAMTLPRNRSYSAIALLGGMSEIRRVTTFFGDLGGTRPQQVRTFSRGNETAEKICAAYGLKDLYGKVGNRSK